MDQDIWIFTLVYKMTKIITCALCGKNKPHKAKSLCEKCYYHKYLKNNLDRKEKKKIYDKKYLKNRKEKRYKNGSQPMNENKSCSSYLGVHIAEQVLSKVFKDVQQMVYGNPGYDFICSNGYKIDVKSSCKHKRNNRSNIWTFSIKKNTISDYFLCLAFDNRTDLNPLYIWLIPNSIVNDKMIISISESTINKWNKYKLNINKVINCCNTLKE